MLNWSHPKRVQYCTKIDWHLSGIEINNVNLDTTQYLLNKLSKFSLQRFTEPGT